jgi:hypothetical protein
LQIAISHMTRILEMFPGMFEFL